MSTIGVPSIAGGSKRTAALAERLGKPCLHLHPGVDAAAAPRDWLRRHPVEILTVAGSRASHEPDVRAFATATLDAVLGAERH